MSRTTASLGPPDDDRDERILLLVSGERDRALVRDRLEGRYEMAGGDPTAEWGAFDLCVVDAPTYDRVADELAERRRAATAYLPVLLLVPERARVGEAERVAAALDGAADDVLVVPAPPAELDARVRALLRVRRQSRVLSLYRRAMDEANVGITISDARQQNNPIVYANDGFLRMTGYDRDEVLGRNHRFLQGPDSSRGAVAELRTAVDEARPVVVELLNYRADGEPFWSRVSVTPVRDRSGELTHFVGFQEDVSDRVERDRELEQYETVVETATQPVCVLDGEGRFTRVNDAMVTATGRSRAELAGTHVSAVSGDPVVFKREIGRVLRGERDDTTFEASIVDTEGANKRYAVSVSGLCGEGFEGVAMVAHDVTDLRVHQRRLSVLDRVLRHNLRNKLNVVLARARQVIERADDESVREAATAIERAGGDLLSTSEAVRQFHGAVDPHDAGDEPVDVVAAVDRALESLRVTYPSTRFEVDCPETARAWGDEALALAVEELLDNAAEATDGEAERVTVSVTDDPERGVVEVAVADEGPGLDADGRRALARGAETPLEHTMGLELWLVRWAVENADGDMYVADNDPHGTVVTVRLRRVE